MNGPGGPYPRGLTLIEVLLSIVLLGVLVGSGASVLRDIQSSAACSETDDSSTTVELALLADRFMDDPAAFGVESWTDLETGRSIASRDVGSRSGTTVEVRLLRSTGSVANDRPDIKHGWIVFVWEGVTVMRWVPLPEEEDDPRETGRSNG